MKVGTFFSGVGSPEQALVNLGIEHEIEFACDIDKYARQTYLKNFDCKNMYDDITSLNMKDLSPVDLLVFGFPCQAFSMAGKRGGFDDTRGTLFYDALRYLKEHRPRYFIAENVKGLISHDSGKTFRTILDCLALTENYQFQLAPFENLDYHVHYKVLNTKDFGVPQNRERIFIIGIRDDEDNNFTFPKPFHLKKKLKDLLENEVDEKYFLSDKTVERVLNTKFDDEKPMDIGRKSYRDEGLFKTLKVGGDVPIFEVKSHSLHPRSGDPTKGGTGHLSKQDGTSYCLDTGNAQAVEIKGAALRGRGHGKELEIRKDDLANSITTVQSDSIIKHSKIRRLTPIECERLQGFPDNHTMGVSDTQRYKQMGNSITVNVMMHLFKQLLTNNC